MVAEPSWSVSECAYIQPSVHTRSVAETASGGVVPNQPTNHFVSFVLVVSCPSPSAACLVCVGLLPALEWFAGCRKTLQTTCVN